ncbi:hypothetical protein J2805_001367 [Arthrobacter oryzae]|nr:hypothetical protein [Arthrobacter oryzae]
MAGRTGRDGVQEPLEAGAHLLRRRRTTTAGRALLRGTGQVEEVRGFGFVQAQCVELTAGELAEIEDAASRTQVAGGRYNEAAERMTNL